MIRVMTSRRPPALAAPVVAAFALALPASAAAQDLDIARFNANGSLDGSFGSGGLVSHSIRPGTTSSSTMPRCCSPTARS